MMTQVWQQQPSSSSWMCRCLLCNDFWEILMSSTSVFAVSLHNAPTHRMYCQWNTVVNVQIPSLSGRRPILALYVCIYGREELWQGLFISLSPAKMFQICLSIFFFYKCWEVLQLKVAVIAGTYAFSICLRSIFFTNANSSKKQIVCVHRNSHYLRSSDAIAFCVSGEAAASRLYKREIKGIAANLHLSFMETFLHLDMLLEPRTRGRLHGHILQAATQRFSSGLKESWQQLLNPKPWTRPICPAVLTKSSLVADMVAAAARMVD